MRERRPFHMHNEQRTSRCHTCGVSDWAQILAVSVSALVAATAALLGAWLQGKLSRRAATEDYDRQIVQGHTNAVRIAASGLLGKIDIAAQGASQLIDPRAHISREVARQTNLSIPATRPPPALALKSQAPSAVKQQNAVTALFRNDLLRLPR